MAMNKDQEFVEYVVKAIVDKPEKVKTSRKVDEMGVLIELDVDLEDMGKVIGKEGRTAKSIRTLLRVLGAKNNARVNLKISEPEGGRGPARSYKSDDKSDDDKDDNKDDDKDDDKDGDKDDDKKATKIV